MCHRRIFVSAIQFSSPSLSDFKFHSQSPKINSFFLVVQQFQCVNKSQFDILNIFYPAWSIVLGHCSPPPFCIAIPSHNSRFQSIRTYREFYALRSCRILVSMRLGNLLSAPLRCFTTVVRVVTANDAISFHNA